MEEQEERPDQQAFNGSIDKLQRMHYIILDCHKYFVNDQVVGLKKNLFCYLTEAQGFLNTDEYDKAWKDWGKIEACKIQIDAKHDYISYDPALPGLMSNYFAWLQLKMHKHKVTMALKELLAKGFDEQYRKYRITKSDGNRI